MLSQRTHSSTVEIRSMIETLQRNTQGAVSTMHEGQLLAQNSVEDANDATQALEQITTSINQISDMATQISSAAEEQRASPTRSAATSRRSVRTSPTSWRSMRTAPAICRPSLKYFRRTEQSGRHVPHLIDHPIQRAVQAPF